MLDYDFYIFMALIVFTAVLMLLGTYLEFKRRKSLEERLKNLESNVFGCQDIDKNPDK